MEQLVTLYTHSGSKSDKREAPAFFPLLIYFRNPACEGTVDVGLPTLINPSQAFSEIHLLSDFRACQVDNRHEPLQSMYTVYRILVRSEYLMK